MLSCLIIFYINKWLHKNDSLKGNNQAKMMLLQLDNANLIDFQPRRNKLIKLTMYYICT